MDPNQSTPPSNRSRNDDNPFMLNTPVRPHALFESPQNLSFTQMLHGGGHPTMYHPSHVPQQPLFTSQSSPNVFTQPFQVNPFMFPQQNQQRTTPCEDNSQTLPDSVPETQVNPSSSTREKNKGKGKGKGKARKTSSGRTNWVEVEEVALSRGWLAISEDNLRGNSQTNEGFWDRVLAHFHHQMGRGEYRTADMLSAKWRDIRAQCSNFQGIYSRCFRQWESGKQDFDVLTAAMKEYKAAHNLNGFNHLESWKVLRDGPKWALHPDILTQSSGSNKRSRTSDSNDFTHYSDAHTRPIDLNDDGDEIESEQFVRPEGRDGARERERERERLRGKSKGKKAASSSRRSVSERDDMSYFKDVFTEHLQFTKTKIEMKREMREQQQVQADLQMLSIKTDGIPEENREAITRVQRSIRDRLKNAFKW